MAKSVLVICLLIAATLLVYASGGTRFAYVHVTYVAIIAGAAFFGFPGGVIVAVLAGIAMGPLMPLDVEVGTAQTATNWLVRAGFFLLIGGSAGFAFHIRDRQFQKIRRQAYHDPITDLPNRALCLNKLNELIQLEPSQTGPLHALSLGVGQFEAIRSSFGHEHSDALQLACAARIKSVLPRDTKLFHISSGVFMLIVMAPMKHAVRLGAALLQAMDEPFVIEGVPVLPGGHVGLAQLGHHATDALSLLRAAISAVQDAEASNQRIMIFNKQIHLSGKSALQLMPDLQRAIRTPDEITLHYQPKVDLKTGICTGAEALVRWRHPIRGWISPAEFIPLAEHTALINPFTERVLDIALAQLSTWEQDGLDLTLAVNLSIRNLEDRDFPTTVSRLLDRHLVNAAHLEVEVTESCLMASLEIVTSNLTALRELGISVALDDFGTGQSSLAYLRDLPADSLKLDRSFLRDLSSNCKSRLLVGATIDTAHKLGFRVVAEGIEDRETYDLLRDLSCDYGQGFFVAKPLAEPDFRAWLSAGLLDH